MHAHISFEMLILPSNPDLSTVYLLNKFVFYLKSFKIFFFYRHFIESFLYKNTLGISLSYLFSISYRVKIKRDADYIFCTLALVNMGLY